MGAEQKFIERIQQLINEGEKINPSNFKPLPGRLYFGAPVNEEKANQWGTSCLSLIRLMFGKDSEHYEKFSSLFPDIDDWSKIRKGIGILESAKTDYEGGFIVSANHSSEERPHRIFISHASHDGNLADALKKEIEKVFAKGVDVFCTSSPGSIQASEDWLQRIENNLSTTQAVIVVVTPASITRPWLWFEIGATWLKGRTGDCKIYPLCAPEINLGDIPPPLDRLQAISIGDPAHLKQFFQALIQQFNFGNISSLRADNIIKWLPEYIDVDASDTKPKEGLLTASTPDVRVTANSGYALREGGEPVYLLSISNPLIETLECASGQHSALGFYPAEVPSASGIPRCDNPFPELGSSYF